MTAPQLIKVMTRGKTSKLSIEPMLEFFRPLEAWLELQNKREPVSVKHLGDVGYSFLGCGSWVSNL